MSPLLLVNVGRFSANIPVFELALFNRGKENRAVDRPNKTNMDNGKYSSSRSG